MMILKMVLVAEMTMVTLMVADVVEHASFIAYSRASLEALKSANLLKALNVNALISGENGVGKTTLASHILSVPIVSGESFDELLTMISAGFPDLIIKDFHKIQSYKRLKNALDLHKTRVIATADCALPPGVFDDFFSLNILIPPLSERCEDIEPLVQKFLKEASDVFGTKELKKIASKDIVLDLSQNGYSLKRSVFSAYIMNFWGENEIMMVLEKFLYNKIGGRSDYREFLHLFDVPIIRAGYAKFGSQLAISEKFGLNRNTLRKKINEYKTKYTIEI
ncbi:MAG: Fis family transcriptional regulator [Sulfurospirillaceae bacterium]|nr:Fis family transcriptional regulator [Sulfurospirillaceae bacterium]